VQEIVEYKFNY